MLRTWEISNSECVCDALVGLHICVSACVLMFPDAPRLMSCARAIKIPKGLFGSGKWIITISLELPMPATKANS